MFSLSPSSSPSSSPSTSSSSSRCRASSAGAPRRSSRLTSLGAAALVGSGGALALSRGGFNTNTPEHSGFPAAAAAASEQLSGEGAVSKRVGSFFNRKSVVLPYLDRVRRSVSSKTTTTPTPTPTTTPQSLLPPRMEEQLTSQKTKTAGQELYQSLNTDELQPSDLRSIATLFQASTAPEKARCCNEHWYQIAALSRWLQSSWTVRRRGGPTKSEYNGIEIPPHLDLEKLEGVASKFLAENDAAGQMSPALERAVNAVLGVARERNDVDCSSSPDPEALQQQEILLQMQQERSKTGVGNRVMVSTQDSHRALDEMFNALVSPALKDEEIATQLAPLIYKAAIETNCCCFAHLKKVQDVWHPVYARKLRRDNTPASRFRLPQGLDFALLETLSDQFLLNNKGTLSLPLERATKAVRALARERKVFRCPPTGAAEGEGEGEGGDGETAGRPEAPAAPTTTRRSTD